MQLAHISSVHCTRSLSVHRQESDALDAAIESCVVHIAHDHCSASVTHPQVIRVATSVPAHVPCHILQILQSSSSQMASAGSYSCAVHREVAVPSQVQLLLTRVKHRKE